jgi:hypothetical protein
MLSRGMSGLTNGASMDTTTLLIQLAGGIAGSGVAASGWKHLSLGSTGNALAGLIGGVLGGQILGSALGTARMTASTGLDPGIFVSEVVGSGIGGAVMLAVVGVLHRAFAR